MQYYGVDAIVRIVSHLMFIYISFGRCNHCVLSNFSKPNLHRKLEC